MHRQTITRSLPQQSQCIGASPSSSARPAPFADEQLVGFIRHPSRFPITCQPMYLWDRWRYNQRQLGHETTAKSGLSFISARYFKPGSHIKISIPSRHGEQEFIGQVVLVRVVTAGYELGVRLAKETNAMRIRVLEQLCHIELYLHDKKYINGPFLSQERLTSEWIQQFAASFPPPHTAKNIAGVGNT